MEPWIVVHWRVLTLIGLGWLAVTLAFVQVVSWYLDRM